MTEICYFWGAKREVHLMTQLNHMWNEFKTKFFLVGAHSGPILVAAQSKAWVCGRSLAGIAGSNPAEDMKACLL